MTIFTLDRADGPGTGGLSFLTFLQGEFYVYMPHRDIMLVNRNSQSLYYALYLDDYETTRRFFDYIAKFVDFEAEYTFPLPYGL